MRIPLHYKCCCSYKPRVIGGIAMAILRRGSSFLRHSCMERVSLQGFLCFETSSYDKCGMGEHKEFGGPKSHCYAMSRGRQFTTLNVHSDVKETNFRCWWDP